LNDDTVPLNNTIPLMVSECTQNPQKIVSAQCYDNLALETQTYGGQKKKGFSINLIAADKNQVLDCDCMSGNLVCFPRSVIDKIGFHPNDKLPHCLADIDYTWTAKQAGYQLEVLGNAIAICEFNHFEGSWINNPLPMKERWKIINSPKSNLYPPAYWYHCQNIHGFLGIFPFTRTYIRLIILTLARIIFPLKFLQTIKAIKDKRKKFDNF
jgi:GT2 family glycosyltransferase